MPLEQKHIRAKYRNAGSLFPSRSRRGGYYPPVKTIGSKNLPPNENAPLKGKAFRLSIKPSETRKEQNVKKNSPEKQGCSDKQ